MGRRQGGLGQHRRGPDPCDAGGGRRERRAARRVHRGLEPAGTRWVGQAAGRQRSRPRVGPALRRARPVESQRAGRRAGSRLRVPHQEVRRRRWREGRRVLHPPEVVDTLVRMLEPRPGDTIYDPTAGSGGMLVHAADHLCERGHIATHARYFAQEMNWGNAAIGKINSVLHGLEADIRAGNSTITDPQFLDDGEVRKFSAGPRQFPVLGRLLVAEAGAADRRQEKEDPAQEGDLRQGGLQGPVRPFRSRHRLSGAAGRLRRLRVHPAHPRFARRRRACWHRLPAGRALPRPAGNRGRDRRLRRRGKAQGEAAQGRRRASHPPGTARVAADRCRRLAAAQRLLRGGRARVPVNPPQSRGRWSAGTKCC